MDDIAKPAGNESNAVDSSAAVKDMDAPGTDILPDTAGEKPKSRRSTLLSMTGIQTEPSYYTDPVVYRMLRWGSLAKAVLYLLGAFLLLSFTATSQDASIRGVSLFTSVMFMYLAVADFSKVAFTKKGWC